MSRAITTFEARVGSILDAGLRIAADVRPGEGVTALLLSVNVFLILTAYYVLKPVREALILAEGSAAHKTYLAVGQMFLLAAIVPIYGRLVKQLNRRVLIDTVTGIFVLCLLAFYAAGRAGAREGVPFFIWLGIFNMMIVAQFWSFANDLYTTDEGERLFPIVGFGASLGAVLGAELAGRVIDHVGLFEVMLVAAALLVAQGLLTDYIDQRESWRVRARAASAKRPRPVARVGAFGLVLRNDYLLLIALMIALYNTINTTGEFLLGKTVQAQALKMASGQGSLAVKQLIGGFYADFYATVNIAGLLLQLFVVSRFVKKWGVPVALLALPAVSLGAYGIIAFAPTLAAVFVAKVGENAINYSLYNTVRAMLLLPCTTEEKYSAKQAIDAFFVRVGDVGAAVLVFVGSTWLTLSTSVFAIVNGLLVVIWLGFAWQIGKGYRRLAAKT